MQHLAPCFGAQRRVDGLPQLGPNGDQHPGRVIVDALLSEFANQSLSASLGVVQGGVQTSALVGRPAAVMADTQYSRPPAARDSAFAAAPALTEVKKVAGHTDHAGRGRWSC